jgi:hypothetical protein
VLPPVPAPVLPPVPAVVVVGVPVVVLVVDPVDPAPPAPVLPAVVLPVELVEPAVVEPAVVEPAVVEPVDPAVPPLVPAPVDEVVDEVELLFCGLVVVSSPEQADKAAATRMLGPRAWIILRSVFMGLPAPFVRSSSVRRSGRTWRGISTRRAAKEMASSGILPGSERSEALDLDQPDRAAS